MPHSRHLIALLLVSGAFFVEPALAGIYTFTDASGVMHFTNVPSTPRYADMKRVAYMPEPVSTTRRARLVDPGRFNPLVEQAAREHQIDQALLRAVIAVESGYDPNAVSRKGAVGLMQLMPQTARRYGVRNMYDPAQNIQGGARYLRDLMGKFNNDLPLVLAAYNAGEEAIAQYGNRIPPYRETRSYVPRVLDFYRQYQRGSR
ncbi:lytic transglycosylase domain-containing protein [Sulfuricaulis limicola]|uniref:lytic transglycosylase domain-containing protein n=1 Tax=Sulfuricaulis limicola TaxID=1620215 RepID=UPI0018D50428|nr:lytic transglycosylase domain-containing protein [Sulfuricaulis limicola]